MTRQVKGQVMAGLASLAAVTLLAACGGSSSGGGAAPASTKSSAASPSASVLAGGKSCSSSATKITFWAWVPGMSRAVTAFNKSHPSICVTLENPGAGLSEYTPLSNALKAGSGAPDVAEIEFDELPSFEIQKQVVDLTKYGANKYQTTSCPGPGRRSARGRRCTRCPATRGRPVSTTTPS